ncbi:hypothetical protein NDU88_011343 [Pleurodeles waltl]|uniref:Uncharacterized protein n=1 Tax=Pleurodeles waltl TaxID=8319 RepID=A0AAV7QXC0_PLEWA|nr:hypothetical protein NDU88_011343 [Pleurodeles waltl]
MGASAEVRLLHRLGSLRRCFALSKYDWSPGRALSSRAAGGGVQTGARDRRRCSGVPVQSLASTDQVNGREEIADGGDSGPAPQLEAAAGVLFGWVGERIWAALPIWWTGSSWAAGLRNGGYQSPDRRTYSFKRKLKQVPR